MPFFNIYSNVELKKSTKESFLTDSMEFVAKLLAKPRERTIINYIHNPNMLFGLYREDFGALVELKSIGFPADKAIVAQKLTDYIHEKLDVDFDHIEIELIDMPASTISIAGKLRA